MSLCSFRHFALITQRVILHFGNDFRRVFTPLGVTSVSRSVRVVSFLKRVSSFNPVPQPSLGGQRSRDLSR